MSNQNVIRAAYYLRISTEEQELDNQRAEIVPFIERRGWKLVHPFEDVKSGRRTEKDRPGFAAMLKAAHQRKFDIVVFWALDPTDQGGYKSDAELSTAAGVERSGVRFVSRAVAGLDRTVQGCNDFDVRDARQAGKGKNIRANYCRT